MILAALVLALAGGGIFIGAAVRRHRLTGRRAGPRADGSSRRVPHPETIVAPLSAGENEAFARMQALAAHPAMTGMGRREQVASLQQAGFSAAPRTRRTLLAAPLFGLAVVAVGLAGTLAAMGSSVILATGGLGLTFLGAGLLARAFRGYAPKFAIRRPTRLPCRRRSPPDTRPHSPRH